MVAANNDKQFRALCAGLRRPDIIEDERWSDPEVRRRNAAGLRAELVKIFRSGRALDWENTLDAAGVPAPKVRSLDETLAENHAKTREFASAMQWARELREIHLPTLGFKVDSEVIAPTTAPPELGGDTREVLRGLGYSDAELCRLEAEAII